MARKEIEALAKYICASHGTLDVDAYTRQLELLYGAAGSQLTAREIDELTQLEHYRIRVLGDGVCSAVTTPQSLVMAYSALAFTMAEKSLLEGCRFCTAPILEQLLAGLMESGCLTQQQKKQLGQTVSETLLDLAYAAGNRGVASFRMAQIIRKHAERR